MKGARHRFYYVCYPPSVCSVTITSIDAAQGHPIDPSRVKLTCLHHHQESPELDYLWLSLRETQPHGPSVRQAAPFSASHRRLITCSTRDPPPAKTSHEIMAHYIRFLENVCYCREISLCHILLKLLIPAIQKSDCCVDVCDSTYARSLTF